MNVMTGKEGNDQPPSSSAAFRKPRIPIWLVAILVVALIALPAAYLYPILTQPDFDGDGIADGNDPDDDNDGLPDSWEELYGFNPRDGADASLDQDTDNLTNLEEFNGGASPLSGDSDNDTLTDWEEVTLYGSSPMLADTDNDTLLDLWEVRGFYNDGIFQDLPGMGADPAIKNIFLEIDWMVNGNRSFEPLPEAIERVKEVFENNPIERIDIIIDAGGEEVPYLDPMVHSTADNLRKNTGSDGQSTGGLSEGRRGFFYYAIFGESIYYDDFYGLCPWVPGDSVLIASGKFPDPAVDRDAVIERQTHTLIHELGHAILGFLGPGNRAENSDICGDSIHSRYPDDVLYCSTSAEYAPFTVTDFNEALWEEMFTEGFRSGLISLNATV